MNELCEKHLQTLKKQTEDANVTEHGQPPSTASHRSQAAAGHRQPPVTGSHRAQAAIGYRQSPVMDSHLPERKFRTNRRKEMKNTNVLSDTNAAVDVNWLEQYGG